MPNFKFIICLSILQALSVLGEICNPDDTFPKSCDYGCCSDDCCPETQWTWYVIIGIALASIVAVVFIFIVVVLLCVYIKKRKDRSPGNTNTVIPSAPPYTINSNRGMVPPPPYAYMEPPPSYEEVQSQTRGAPRPTRSTGIPKVSSRTMVQPIPR